MIPGSAKETAALAISYTLAPKGWNAPKGWLSKEAERKLRLAERRELMRNGYLPGSIGAHRHAVAVGVDLVEIEGEDAGLTFDLVPSVARALTATATGAYALWFNDTGNAFLSFDHEEDATLFRLALDA